MLALDGPTLAHDLPLMVGGSLAEAQRHDATPGAAPERLPKALPEGWDGLWHHPEPTAMEWSRLVRGSRRLAESIDLRPEHRVTFGPLVGSEGLRDAPVHRWFTYKEGFSAQLLGAVLDALGVEGPITVADAFGGVATTALSAQFDARVSEVRSVEYSPFAHFAGQVKLDWHRLEPERLRRLLPAALDYQRRTDLPVPDLAAFHNPRIFHRNTLHSLLSAREHLRVLSTAKAVERRFLLLGLAAVVEDLSGAMKDGRALRIKGDRRRKPSSLAATNPAVRARGSVKRALAGQWTAMIEDLEALTLHRAAAATTPTQHLRGDARHLEQVQLGDDLAFPDGWAGLALFSPPYLNCLDYTELYKLELWLMEHITTQAQFKQTRRGTLRSHPSVRFERRGYFDGEGGSDIDLITRASDWICAFGSRREVGPVVREYFEDMLQVWREQRRVLAADGVAVCVVANSTFARRERDEAGFRTESWRLPLLTDVLLAHLARRAGFGHVEIWPARDLRPRNARAGRARESLVVASERPLC
jgi:hypothetical protein